MVLFMMLFMMLKKIIVIDNDDGDDAVDYVDKDWAASGDMNEDDDFDVDGDYVRCC